MEGIRPDCGGCCGCFSTLPISHASVAINTVLGIPLELFLRVSRKPVIGIERTAVISLVSSSLGARFKERLVLKSLNNQCYLSSCPVGEIPKLIC